MAAIEDRHAVFFSALENVWLGDGNRLGGASVDLGVRAFVREGTFRDNLPVPYIVVSIQDAKPDSIGQSQVDCRATLTVHTQKNLSLGDEFQTGEQNHIAGEIQRLYDDADLSSIGTNWGFGRCFVGPERQLPPLGDYNRFAVTVRALGYRKNGTNLRQLVGNEASVTWTQGSGGAPIYTAQAEVVGLRIGTDQTFDFRGPGETWAKPEQFTRSGSLLLRVKTSAGSNTGPFMPDGVEASVTVFKDGAATSNGKWAFSCRVFRTDITMTGGSLGGEPQTAVYECRSIGAITETR